MCKAVIIAFDCLFRFKTVMRRVHTILLANHNDKIRLIERITIILFSSQYELLQHRDIGTTWKFFKFQVSFLAGHNFITKISFVLRAVWFAKPVLVPLIVWIMIAHKLNSIIFEQQFWGNLDLEEKQWNLNECKQKMHEHFHWTEQVK